MLRPFLVVAVVLSALSASAVGPGAPRNVRCEYATNPLGIGVVVPRLSWEVTDSRRGAVQSAYQIEASLSEFGGDTGGAALWDSGKVASDQSIQVPWGGPAAVSGQRVYWRVRTWDRGDVASDWSESGWWEWGLLGAGDWQARWISMEEERSGASPVFGDWIWHPVITEDEDRRYFRRVVELPAEVEVQSARLWGAANNEFYCYVNGEYAGGCDEWKAVEEKDFTALLKPGRNVFAIRAVHDRLKAGFSFGARITLADGQEIEVRSDGDWQCSDEDPEAWQTLDFDASAWVPAVRQGAYGEAPFEDVAERFPSRSYQLRKEFEARSDVVRARVYASGLGLYRLYVNGQRVGQEELAPGWTHFKKRVYYQCYDVTELIRDGENVVGLLLGNGWWGGCMAGAWKDGNLRAIAQLELVYRDGTRQIVATDPSWQGALSPIVSDSIYNGETHDGRLEQRGWSAPGFDASAWKPAQAIAQPLETLVAQIGPAIQVTEDIPALSVKEVRPGAYIFDFGQNAAGRTRLSVEGPAGTAVKIRHGEILQPDGALYTENLRGAKCTDTYILRGDGLETWEPAFSYAGFRYAEVTGYPGVPTTDTLTLRVMHTQTPMTGEFTCSEDVINRVQENTLWGMRSNFYSVPTDCPQRDERLGWTGDMQLFLPAACVNMDVAGYMSKWMEDIVDSRNADGSIPDVAPAGSAAAGAPGWSDIVVTLPWNLYTYYGDTRLIEKHYGAMADFLDFMRKHSKDGLYSRGRYGDWVALENSSRDALASAYQILSTQRLSTMAKALGREAEGQALASEAETLRGLYNERYFNTDTGAYQTGEQTAQVIPLAFGIVPEAQRPGVVDALAENFVRHDQHPTTGFVGTAYLMPTLSESGLDVLAGHLATDQSYPSWGYMVASGATTIWERWNSNQPEAMNSGMNSFNHFAFGIVSQWYYEYLLGIQPLAPGYKKIHIAPRIEAAQWAKGACHTLYGPVRCEWSKEGSFTLTVEIPANTRALITPPVPCDPQEEEGVHTITNSDGTQSYEVGAGVYHFAARGH